MKTVVVYGSTGSIGTQTLNVLRSVKDKFRVLGLFAGENVELLKAQIEEFSPERVYIKTKEKALYVKSFFKGEVFWGEEGVLEFIDSVEADISVIGLSGSSGILPTYLAISKSKRIALANKEAIVSAGKFIIEKAKEMKVEILPVDSEHSAIFQCLRGNDKKFVEKIILTASGGPFLNYPKEKFDSITVEEALNHPTWSMGKKISVDSATMMNKALEIIEASWLFDVSEDKIDVVIHPQSIVHSMVKFTDGSIISQLGVPSMEIPISYALFFPERGFLSKELDFSNLSLSFYLPDFDKFPTLNFGYEALRKGKGYPAALNSANEVAVESFLKNKIKFTDIFKINEKVFDFDFPKNFNSIDDVFFIHTEVKKRLKPWIEKR